MTESLDPDVIAIQRAFPRVYLACHVDHVRASSDGARLSPRDASILAHLSAEWDSSPSALARHLGVTRATLSEALAKLAGLGYVETQVDDGDERRRRVRLTEDGTRALSRSSVLDYARLANLLARLDPDERRRAVEGLGLLGEAAMRGESGEE